MFYIAPPAFTAIPSPRVTGYVDGSVTFNFKLVGTPKPQLLWYRDGQSITVSADYVILMEDKIILNELIEQDSGMYEARASNHAGEASLSLELIVLPQGKYII